MQVRSLDRVIIVTPDLEGTVGQFEDLLGLSFDDPKEAETESPAGVQRMRLTHGPPGIEIITPEDEDNAIANFIDSHGPGLYGVVLRVDDLEAAKAELSEKGVDPISETGGAAAEAFYHPKHFGGVLTLLTEYSHPMMTD